MLTFESRFPLWFLVIGLAAVVWNLYFAVRSVPAGAGPGSIAVWRVAGTALASVLIALALRNRLRRPTVAIGDDAILYANVFQLFRWKIVPSQVAEILPGDRHSVRVRLRSGRERKIGLREVAKAERETARQAICDAIAQR